VLALLAVLAAGLGLLGASPGTPRNADAAQEKVPALLLEGGRRLDFVRAFSSEMEVKPKRSLWNKLVDWVAGPPAYRRMLRPYDIALDSAGRVIVTDPGAPAVHILDFEKQK